MPIRPFLTRRTAKAAPPHEHTYPEIAVEAIRPALGKLGYFRHIRLPISVGPATPAAVFLNLAGSARAWARLLLSGETCQLSYLITILYV